MDLELRYDTHITSVARQTSQRVSALRRMAGSLDSRGILTFYRAQIRPCMEYGALTWMSSAHTHTSRLDTIQRRALRLLGEDEESVASITSLEHRRDVATLTVCHKAQVLHTPRLSCLSLPPHPPGRNTRQAADGDQQVLVPLSRSSQHQRTFRARAARLWNQFTVATPAEVAGLSTQQTKVAANVWRSALPARLVQ
ncbi:uncharacterized protein LOC123517380 [Portunus trituberculatus]|uniref:uncharacterized protein LOC123517380 n=1 Tax=Portunus trituberculatus TaxID=210409 RepID=UPI001E1D102F|nr:uncharacterized protein LOC123517380 [Portunus trituberculatus]